MSTKETPEAEWLDATPSFRKSWKPQLGVHSSIIKLNIKQNLKSTINIRKIRTGAALNNTLTKKTKNDYPWIKKVQRVAIFIKHEGCPFSRKIKKKEISKQNQNAEGRMVGRNPWLL